MDAKTAKEISSKVVLEKYGKYIEVVYSSIAEAANQGLCCITVSFDSEVHKAVARVFASHGYGVSIGEKELKVTW